MYKLANYLGVEVRRGTIESLLSVIDMAVKLGARLFVWDAGHWIELDW
jgi:hypothetical protein